jgi:hypothetical protein
VPSHYASIQGASLLLLHSGFGLHPLALQFFASVLQMGHFASRASGMPFTFAQSRHEFFRRPCSQTLRPKHSVQFTARVMPLLSGQVHMIWRDFLRSCRSRRRSRASCSRGRRKHKTYLLGRRGLQRRCGLRLGRHGGLGKLVAVIHGTRNRCLVFGEAVALISLIR